MRYTEVLLVRYGVALHNPQKSAEHGCA